eukprot:4238947-Pyramimonas_sp.AAC.2
MQENILREIFRKRQVSIRPVTGQLTPSADTTWDIANVRSRPRSNPRTPSRVWAYSNHFKGANIKSDKPSLSPEVEIQAATGLWLVGRERREQSSALSIRFGESPVRSQEEEKEIETSIKAIIAERTQENEAREEVRTKIRAVRNGVRREEGDYQKNRRLIRKLKDLVEKKDYEAAETLSQQQLERVHARLASDAGTTF